MEEAQQRIRDWLATGNTNTPLNMSWLHLTELPPIPDTVEILECAFNFDLKTLPNLPPNLKGLYCMRCSLESLPILPDTLVNLSCSYNNLSELPNIPSQLVSLSCENNHIRELRNLPDSLQELLIQNNRISILPPLPANLQRIQAYDNLLREIPVLPETLTSANFINNPLIEPFKSVVNESAYMSTREFIDKVNAIHSIKNIKNKARAVKGYARSGKERIPGGPNMNALVGSFLTGVEYQDPVEQLKKLKTNYLIQREIVSRPARGPGAGTRRRKARRFSRRKARRSVYRKN